MIFFYYLKHIFNTKMSYLKF